MDSRRLVCTFAIIWSLQLVSVIVCAVNKSVDNEYKRVCHGTNNGLSHPKAGTKEDALKRFNEIRSRYTNCSYVDGNLELSYLNHDEVDYNMSFLKDIEEVTGYVLIGITQARVIPLTKLRIIRGRSLLSLPAKNESQKSYSLYVAYNYNMGLNDTGLHELRLTNLTEISYGSVLFHHNKFLCHVDTINWVDILSGEGDNAVFQWANHSDNKTQCSKCHDHCKSFCWGNGRHKCQKLTRVNCAPQCSGRCYGTHPNQCCHPECAAGCRGPRDTDCFACKNFKDGNHCVPFCPQLTTYDPILKKMKPNPSAKYAYGSQCVTKCPPHLIADQGACVVDCSAGFYASPDGNCIECKGLCPKKCEGTGEEDWIHAHNIDSFVNCTLVQGSIKIQEVTFNGDPDRSIPPLQLHQLNALENVQEITDYLTVAAPIDELRNLSFLRNLKVIQGRHTGRGGTSIYIHATKLEILGLDSLKEIRNGRVAIGKNEKLCFVQNFNWSKIHIQESKAIQIFGNLDDAACAKLGMVCSDECGSDGCMGPGNHQCLTCAHFSFGRQCLDSCAEYQKRHLYLINGSNECAECHDECLDACHGPGADQCDGGCRHVRLGSECVAACPVGTSIHPDGVCHNCHSLCVDGCTGDGSWLGDGGCNACELVTFENENSTASENVQCVPYLTNATCMDGYYHERYIKHNEGRKFGISGACRKCHEECEQCVGPGNSEDYCKVCVNLKEEDRCVPQCSDSMYQSGSVCKSWNQHAIIVGATVGGIFLILVIVVCILVLRKQLAKTEEKKLQLTAKITGHIECEPLIQGHTKPDMAVLRVIKESDLKRGNIIGSGAFGTVYKGYWIPEGENLKIPVAIKVLQESSEQNQNLLEEARIMASVVHPCCVQILAVCMTADILLVTQLMPLGCLLDYVRKHKDGIGSKLLLNWSTQIAKGMGYLEERGIIHRDLAARNVLVQTVNHVKITDFGLAKLVNDEGQFLSIGGKLPIKWLALESIRNKIFTHKSDVWSFGVTVWELFTYGQRPYENVSATDIVDLLEKGERLPQPPICTIDVYMVMIKCWVLDANGRPSFSDLAEEFAKMARDPGRYLVIPNDKLMRLPSQPQDPRDLLRNISMASDGPEEMIMADEYVNNASNRRRLITQLDKPPDRPSNYCDRKRTRTDPSVVNPPVPGQQSTLHPPSPPTDPTHNKDGRYSPDPRGLPSSPLPSSVHDTVDGPVAFTVSPSVSKQAFQAMRALPLDSTDYLQPNSAFPTSYLELVQYNSPDKSFADEEEEEEVEMESSMNDVGFSKDKDAADESTSMLLPSSTSAASAINNPEYFQSSTSIPLLTTTNSSQS